MENLIEFYAGKSSNLPHGFDNKKDHFEVFEALQNSDNTPIKPERSQQDRDWIDTVKPNSALSQRRVLLRLVLIPTSNRSRVYRFDIKQEIFSLLFRQLDLKQLYRLANTSPMTFDVIPMYDPQGAVSGFSSSLFIETYIWLYLTHHHSSGLTQGICWATPGLLSRLQDALISLQSLARHPHYILLCIALAFNSSDDINIIAVHEYVGSVEKRTGYHGWDVGEYRSAEGPFSELSAKTSGFATALTATKRPDNIIDEILGIFEDTLLVPSTLDVKLLKAFEAHVKTLRMRTAMQHKQADFLLSRVQHQLTALFNLSNREEMKLSIGLAEDSRIVATASQRDSSSMKTLAAVTVLFLPGTAIASLFSMSMFNWSANDSSDVLSGRFWVYWAISVPLTVTTVVSWLAWSHRQSVLDRIKDREAVKRLSF
ncbi:MAG: hypothetical protein Q9160_005436 [Pyrenula sp. 1 TL-2023]